MNRGNLSFAEVGQWAGVSASDWAWGVCFLDVDLDGFEDVLISNGHERTGRDIDVSNQLKAFRKSGDRSKKEILQKRMEFPRYATANIALRNRRDGSFEACVWPIWIRMETWMSSSIISIHQLLSFRISLRHRDTISALRATGAFLPASARAGLLLAETAPPPPLLLPSSRRTLDFPFYLSPFLRA